MDSPRPDSVDPSSAVGVSRRQALLRASAGGLAAVFAMRGIRQAFAQEATAGPSPTPTYAVGVTPEILGRIEPPMTPGYVLQLVRITFAPDAAVAAHRHSGATVTTQMSGSHAFTVLEGDAHLIRAGSATPSAELGAGELMEHGREYTINPGDAIVFDESVVHTAHNPNGEPAVLMEAQLRASDRPLTEFMPEMATPVG
jgi:quercetin dioxygenase-like cupin family protein